MTPQHLGEYVIRKFENMKAQRTNWDHHWSEVAEYIIPKKDNIYGLYDEGAKKGNRLYDSTGLTAAETLSSSLHGMLTNPSSFWFGLSTGIKELDRDPLIKEWLQEVTRQIHQVFNFSNFTTEIHEVYLDLVSFGSVLFRVLEDDQLVVRFEARPIYESYVLENNKGLIDTVYYEYEMTYEQMIDEFGEKNVLFACNLTKDALSRAMLAAPMDKFKIIHAVEPRRHTTKKGPKGLPFASYHVFKETQRILKEGGFHENPNIVARWTKIAGEIYGRSPGMKALPDIKMINKMEKAVIEAAQLAIRPPMQVPDDGVLLPVRTNPNDVNYYRAGSKDRIEPLFTGANPQLGAAMMDRVAAKIEKAFFIDQLRLVENDRMTATEVTQRRDEQLRLLGPILGRMQWELLKPLVDRVFGILQRNNMLPAAPEALQGANLEVKYTSQIAKAQMIGEAENVLRGLQYMGSFLQIKPEAADYLNGDEGVKYIADAFGWEAGLMLDDDSVGEIREARAEQAQQEQAMIQQAQEAETASKLGGMVE